MTEPCTWPSGTCQCYLQNTTKPDPWGRVWMHSEEGLRMSKNCIGTLVTFCLQNNIEIGTLWSLNPHYSRSLLTVTVKLKPEQFEEFERVTGGKLKEPPKIHLN